MNYTYDGTKNLINNDSNAATNNIAVLIPAYNEEKYIDKVLDNCLSQNLDIIVIDDGSTDRTAEIISNFDNKTGKKIHLVKHDINKGKGEALKSGFLTALKNNYTGVITIDADGQHKVDEIAGFIEAVNKYNPDIIVGNRLENAKGMPFIRLFTNIFTSWIISIIASKKIADVQSGFRFIGCRAMKNIKLETKNFDTEPEILLKAGWLGYDIINIPISTIYHKNFNSHVNPIKDTIKFIRLILKSISAKRKFKRCHTSL